MGVTAITLGIPAITAGISPNRTLYPIMEGYGSVRLTLSFYLIIPFLREGYDSVRWGMIKFKMAMLGYDLVNCR